MKKNIILFLILILFISLISGCSKGTVNNVAEEDLGDTYPINTDVTLTYWAPFTNSATAGVKTMAELPFYQEVMKKTGVKVEFKHPIEGGSGDQFNLMLASGDLPDIIENDWYNFTGGPMKAIEDGYIIKLNDAFNKYSPNLTKYLNEHKDIDNMIRTDEGTYYNYPFIRGDKNLLVYNGPMIRKDWLDDLGLSIPETIDEWYNVLTEFKNKKNATAPLSVLGLKSIMQTGGYIGAYGAKSGLYLKDRKVVMGELQSEFKDGLILLRKWYADGLLDKNVANTDKKTLDANILSGKAGATIAGTIGGIGKYMNAMASKDVKYELVPTKYPSIKKGETAEFGQFDLPYTTWNCAAISTSCKNVQVAARFLDYAYSEEGKMLFNFGIEGISYNMVDNYPKYTDVIMKNPNGKSIVEMIGTYCRPNGAGPFVQDARYMEQSAVLPQQKDSLKIWALTNAEEHILPNVYLTTEERTQAAVIQNNINTYNDEMLLKFVTGVKPIEEFDDYVTQLKKLEAEKLINIYQNALDRYNSR